MTSPDTLRELQLLVRSHYGLIIIETEEYDRLPDFIRAVARALGVMFYQWTHSKGLFPANIGVTTGFYGTSSPAQALRHIESLSVPGLYYFEPFDAWINDKATVSHLRDASEKMTKGTGAIVIAGEGAKIPEILRPFTAVYHLPTLTQAQYREFIEMLVFDVGQTNHVRNKLTEDDLQAIVANVKGMTLSEIRRVLTRAMLDDNQLTKEDLKYVLAAKKEVVEKGGQLEFFPSADLIGDIAGLAGLKEWLSKRRNFFNNPEKSRKIGLEFPKGILLLGVQGCGKSLCAKAVANDWRMPLLRLDASKIYDKYIGESEKNFSGALRLAEKIAPVVLWIDEIEKVFSPDGAASDSGTSQRIFGSFLTWLQERKGDVFIVATANNIEKLPPEFLRKGRFDEIFFVDLPTDEIRRVIFTIHLKKKNQDLRNFDLAELSKATEGFSGAEIEQTIISALYSCLSGNSGLDTINLVLEIKKTRPLSRIMSEKITSLREWAKTRTVSAD